MEFRKIDESKFQCLLLEEDLEENNISLDDFFRNDTEKIHSLLDVIMQEARKSIGVVMDKGVMSLQLAPQPNKSILLTISSGADDFSDMLKQAGERASQIVSSFSPDENKDSDIIKNSSKENLSAMPFDIFNTENSENKNNSGSLSQNGSIKQGTESNKSNSNSVNNNVIKAAVLVFEFDSIEDIEEFCVVCPKTWGISNSIYKDCNGEGWFLILEKGRCSDLKYKLYTELLIEYARFVSSSKEKISYIHEHCEAYIEKNAINKVKKYCGQA